MRIKRIGTVIASFVSAATAVVALATPAQAYGPSYCNGSTCSLSISSNTSGIYFEMPRSTPVTMICWTDDQWWNGTNRWFKVDSLYGRGFMIATQVSNQTRVGHC
ncbi:hypothetical protein OG271_05090 [Micromonospora rifamycinica]|uniref:hypothetical protein n=1 Tax=Micromonospora rifamycinica TaxID=291594 RepID=UPI002E2E258A|nr:hypothetical protein [Micromonospora rifamycinica]